MTFEFTEDSKCVTRFSLRSALQDDAQVRLGPGGNLRAR